MCARQTVCRWLKFHGFNQWWTVCVSRFGSALGGLVALALFTSYSTYRNKRTDFELSKELIMALLDSILEVLREEGIVVSEAIQDAVSDLVNLIEDENDDDDIIEDDDFYEDED